MRDGGQIETLQFVAGAPVAETTVVTLEPTERVPTLMTFKEKRGDVVSGSRFVRPIDGSLRPMTA